MLKTHGLGNHKMLRNPMWDFIEHEFNVNKKEVKQIAGLVQEIQKEKDISNILKLWNKAETAALTTFQKELVIRAILTNPMTIEAEGDERETLLSQKAYLLNSIAYDKAASDIDILMLFLLHDHTMVSAVTKLLEQHPGRAQSFVEAYMKKGYTISQDFFDMAPDMYEPENVGMWGWILAYTSNDKATRDILTTYTLHSELYKGIAKNEELHYKTREMALENIDNVFEIEGFHPTLKREIYQAAMEMLEIPDMKTEDYKLAMDVFAEIAKNPSARVPYDIEIDAVQRMEQTVIPPGLQATYAKNTNNSTALRQLLENKHPVVRTSAIANINLLYRIPMVIQIIDQTKSDYQTNPHATTALPTIVEVKNWAEDDRVQKHFIDMLTDVKDVFRYKHLTELMRPAVVNITTPENILRAFINKGGEEKTYVKTTANTVVLAMLNLRLREEPFSDKEREIIMHQVERFIEEFEDHDIIDISKTAKYYVETIRRECEYKKIKEREWILIDIFDEFSHLPIYESPVHEKEKIAWHSMAEYIKDTTNELNELNTRDALSILKEYVLSMRGNPLNIFDIDRQEEQHFKRVCDICHSVGNASPDIQKKLLYIIADTNLYKKMFRLAVPAIF